MSSSLDQIVPVLSGVNYRDWAVRMTAYLSQHNLLGYATGDIKKPAIPTRPASAARIAQAVLALNEWASKDEQVMGTIVLRCAPSVRAHLIGQDSSCGYWNALKDAYKPKPAVNRKQKLGQDHLPSITMEEAILASKVIAENRKNNAPTLGDQRKLADQILTTLLSKPSISDASPKRRQRGGKLSSPKLPKDPKGASQATRISADNRKGKSPASNDQQPSANRFKALEDIRPGPDAKTKRGSRGGKKVRAAKARREASQAMADSSANTQNGIGARIQNANQNAGPSKLTVTTPSGLSDESKPTESSTASTGCSKGPGDFFPKMVAESRNLADKLGIPVNTSELATIKVLEKQREQSEASTSYKDALLTIAAAVPDISLLSNAERDFLNKVLKNLHIEENPQDRSLADHIEVDQVPSTPVMIPSERKLQRSQRKKVIHSVPLVNSEPKTGPSKLNKGSNGDADKSASRKDKKYSLQYILQK